MIEILVFGGWELSSRINLKKLSSSLTYHIFILLLIKKMGWEAYAFLNNKDSIDDSFCH